MEVTAEYIHESPQFPQTMNENSTTEQLPADNKTFISFHALKFPFD